MSEAVSDGMQRVLAFLNAFTETEYRVTMTRYDPSLDEQQQEAGVRVLLNFYHSVDELSLGRYTRTRLDLSDKSLHVYKRPEQVRRRVIFQVRRHHKPKLGEGFRRHVRSDEIYACYAGYDRGGDGFSSLSFCDVYFAAETDEGLRILYHYSYSSTHGGWSHPCLLEHLQVHAPGRLMEVHRLTPPSDSKENLEEYHSDTQGLKLVHVE